MHSMETVLLPQILFEGDLNELIIYSKESNYSNNVNYLRRPLSNSMLLLLRDVTDVMPSKLVTFLYLSYISFR